jgi:PTS system nitrogen regulatory IIA component
MHLRELLTVERIDTDLDANDKAEALKEMARLLAGGLYPSAGSGAAPSAEEVWRVLSEREAVASTGIGDGVAIPHGRLPGLTKFVGALGIQRNGVAFESVDGRPASILFALIGPDRAAGEHLKCLARISRLLRDTRVRERLIASGEPEKALEIVLAHDG